MSGTATRAAGGTTTGTPTRPATWALTGTGALLVAFLRRDRWWYWWWSVGAALLYVSQAWSVDATYTTQAELDRMAAVAEGNAAFIAMLGPARALDTVGGQVTWQAAAFGAVLAGLMSMFLVGRHTRAEEETGRDELVRAAAVGPHAPMTAALANAFLANVVLGVFVAGALVAYGLAVPDSVNLGVGLTLCGWFFSGAALVAMQVTASTRAAYGIAGTVVGAAYALRAIGDVSVGALSWLSPIGWYQAMHAFSGARWWPALLLLGAALAVTASAYVAFGRRDFGAGLFQSRPGPARAAARLAGARGLAWRLQRGTVTAWVAGLLIGGLCFGVMGDDVRALVGNSSLSQQLIMQGLSDVVDAFYAMLMAMLAMLAAGFAISSALRPRAEEEAGRLEALLGTALPRSHWLGGHVAVTVVGTVACLAASGLGLGTSYALVTGDGGAVVRLSVPMLQFLPAVLVLSGLARLLHGVAPRAAHLAWVGLGFVAVVLMFGDLWRLPSWLRDLSPFQHLARVPAQEFRPLPFLVLSLVALTLSVAGQIAFRRRDVH